MIGQSVQKAVTPQRMGAFSHPNSAVDGMTGIFLRPL